ncbi:MAG: TetR/AcrR family transcriptional regulator [Hyphomicrobiaceae bacterium]
MSTTNQSVAPDSRERLIQAGYELLTQRGAGGTSVDLIAGRANCAKATLYNIFGSKTALTLAVLQRREELWTRGWLETGIKLRASRPNDQLLAMFDLFHDWFRRDDFEGCTFMKLLLESSVEANVRDAALTHLANVRLLIANLADEAGICDAQRFAEAWLMIMQGAIMAASEGNVEAARVAKRLAVPVLAAWPRRA